MIKTRIAGTGSFIPEKIITNKDMEKIVDTTDEWITSRTGVITRHKCNDDATTSEIAFYAAQKALEMSGTSPEELELIIIGTASPEMLFPSTACILQRRLGAKNAGAFDLLAACTGFIYALSIGDQFIKTGNLSTILVMGAEILSKITNYKDRTTCILFGDGSGAAVLKKNTTGSDSGIIYSKLLSDGNLEHLIQMPAGGTRQPASHETVEQNLHTIHMKGNETYKHAVKLMYQITNEALEKNNLKIEDIALFIPHQANIRIIKALAQRLNISEDKVFINIDKYGNTSSASVPIALDEAVRSGKIKEGDLILLTAFGGGLTYGTVLIKW